MCLLKIVLYTNYFNFNNTIYKQIHGIAMGTACTCTISDIFICNFVKKHFFNWTYQPRYYKQYRDDSFGIWLHKSTLSNYINHLNSIHPNLKFTLTFGKSIQAGRATVMLCPSARTASCVVRVRVYVTVQWAVKMLILLSLLLSWCSAYGSCLPFRLFLLS